MLPRALLRAPSEMAGEPGGWDSGDRGRMGAGGEGRRLRAGPSGRGAKRSGLSKAPKEWKSVATTRQGQARGGDRWVPSTISLPGRRGLPRGGLQGEWAGIGFSGCVDF